MIKVVLYYHPIEFWEQWIESTIDRTGDLKETQTMCVILSNNIRN